MFTHCSGGAIWQVMFDVASASGFVILPVGCPTCVPPGVGPDDLPEPLADEVVVVHSGDELLDVVLRS